MSDPWRPRGVASDFANASAIVPSRRQATSGRRRPETTQDEPKFSVWAGSLRLDSSVNLGSFAGAASDSPPTSRVGHSYPSNHQSLPATSRQPLTVNYSPSPSPAAHRDSPRVRNTAEQRGLRPRWYSRMLLRPVLRTRCKILRLRSSRRIE